MSRSSTPGPLSRLSGMLFLLCWLLIFVSCFRRHVSREAFPKISSPAACRRSAEQYLTALTSVSRRTRDDLTKACAPRWTVNKHWVCVAHLCGPPPVASEAVLPARTQTIFFFLLDLLSVYWVEDPEILTRQMSVPSSHDDTLLPRTIWFLAYLVWFLNPILLFCSLSLTK